MKPEEWDRLDKEAKSEHHRSVITYLGRDAGSVDLATARRHVLGELEELEASLDGADQELFRADHALKAAQRERDKAYEARQRFRNAVNQKRADLFRRFPQPPEEI